MKTGTTKIPETGGANRSPIRDDFISLVTGAINLDEKCLIDNDLKKTLLNLYDPGISWRPLLDDTLDIFHGRFVNRLEHSKMNGFVIESVLPLVDFILDYLESFGVATNDEVKAKVFSAVKDFDMMKLDYFKTYLSLQFLIGNIEKIRSHGKLQGYYECSDTFTVGTARIFEGFLIMKWDHVYTPGEVTGSIFSYDALLCLRDMLLKRSIATFVSDSNMDFLGARYPSPETVEAVIDWGDEVLSNGNDYYGTIACYESILTGTIIEEHDSFRNGDFLSEMRDQTNSVSPRVKVLTDKMVEAIRSESAPAQTQCFSLFKLWSFPTVDEEEAMSTLVEYGRHKKYVNSNTMATIAALGRREFFTSYVRIHNSLPEGCFYTGNEEDYLHRVVEGTVDFLIEYEGTDYKLSQWEHVVLRGAIEPIFDADIGSYMKDKAISPELDELWQVYQKDYIPDEVKSEGGRSTRSGILRYIQGDIASAWSLVQYVEEHGSDKAWRVVGVTAKEKEHKPSARLFAMLVLQMKLWFAVTEDCLKKALFKYFPQQSMDQTYSQAAEKKFYMSSKASSEYFKITMNIDFSKWNTTFRNENTLMVFLFVDELFDFKRVYTYTHQFFENCRVYLSSRYTIPESLIASTSHSQSIDPSTEDTLWFHGFLGGFEGQRQKGWTLVTLLFMIYIIEVKCSLKNYLLYGQGDNQVVELNIKKSDWDLKDSAQLSDCEGKVKTLMRDLRDALKEGCNEIGLRVKTEETWFSSSFFQYSKDFYILGARMPLDMKQMLALSPHNKLIVPTQFEIYKMMVSTINACFDSSHSVIVTYLLGMYLCNLLLLVDDFVYDRRPLIRFSNSYSKKDIPTPQRLIWNKGPRFLEIMSKIPSSLGGSCDIVLSNMIRKGKGDFVEGAVDSMIRTSCSYCLSYLDNLMRFGLQPPSKTDPTILLVNYLSINLKIEDEEGDTLKSSMLRYLEEESGGDIKTAFGHFMSPQHSSFKGTLINKGTAFNPTLSSIVYDLSVFSSVQTQIEKIDGATMNRMAGVRLQSFMHRVSEINRKKIDFLFLQAITRFKYAHNNVSNSVTFTSSLRDSWTCGELKLSIGRMMPNMYIQSGELSPSIPPSMLLSIVSSQGLSEINCTRGPSKPSLRVSNETEKKTTGIKVPSGRIKKTLEEVADILPSLCEKGSSLHTLVKKQVSTVTDFNIDSVIDWTHIKEVRLLETSSIPSASNFQTLCKFIFSDSLRRELLSNDEKFEVEKVKHTAVSLANLQQLLDPLMEEKTFWVVYKKQAEIHNPSEGFKFVPSSISIPSSHIYFVNCNKTLEYEQNRTRRTDDILSITMLLDSALANEGLFRLNGVPKRPLPSIILTYDARLVFLIFTIRFMISAVVSIKGTEEAYKGEVELHSESLNRMFKRYMTDEGLQSLTNSELGYHTRSRKKSTMIKVLLMSGFHQLKQIFRSSYPTFLRLTVLYEVNPVQADLLAQDTLEFLGECIGCEPDLNTIQNEYDCSMTHYGRKKFVPVLPKLRSVEVEAAPSSFVADSNEAYRGEKKTLGYMNTPLYQSIGMYQSLFSLVSNSSYDLIIIHDIPSEMKDLNIQESKAYVDFIRLLRGRKFESRSGKTLMYNGEESSVIVGKLKLGVENVVLRGADTKDLSDILGISVLNVGVEILEEDTVNDWLTFSYSNGSGNVFSFFSDLISLTRADKKEVYPFLSKSFNIRQHFPDWALRHILYEEMKDLTQGRYTGRINSREIVEFFKADKLRSFKISDIAEVYGQESDSGRISAACDSVHRARLLIISSRIGIRTEDLESRGNNDYNEEISFSAHLSSVIGEQEYT